MRVSEGTRSRPPEVASSHFKNNRKDFLETHFLGIGETLLQGTAGDGAVFSPTGGAQLNASASQAPDEVKNIATVKYYFPYPPNASYVTSTVVDNLSTQRGTASPYQ
jgi:hypothetical protein